jgi:hypothetical protein
MRYFEESFPAGFSDAVEFFAGAASWRWCRESLKMATFSFSPAPEIPLEISSLVSLSPFFPISNIRV